LRTLFEAVQKVNSFRNRHVPHPVKALTDPAVFEENLRPWVDTLAPLAGA
jgi:hypothetical protein